MASRTGEIDGSSMRIKAMLQAVPTCGSSANINAMARTWAPIRWTTPAAGSRSSGSVSSLFR
jgi:hypothetical protein